MLVLGDAHAATPDRRDALLAAYRATDADVALQVGDLQHYDLPAPTWFVAGNNEDFDVVEAMRTGDRPVGVSNAHLLASSVAEVGGRRVAGLSGNFAPTRFEKARDQLEGGRRRHFVRADVDRAADLAAVDVLLVHEAPNGILSYGYDPGCTHVNRLLRALEPDLCLVGHHHEHRASEVEGVRTVSLAPVWERYYTLAPEDLTLESYGAPVEAPPPD